MCRFSSFGDHNSSAAKAALTRNRAGKWVSGMTGKSALSLNETLPSALDGLRWPSFTLATSGVVRAKAEEALLTHCFHVVPLMSPEFFMLMNNYCVCRIP